MTSRETKPASEKAQMLIERLTLANRWAEEDINARRNAVREARRVEA